MTGYTVHTGASKKFVSGWDKIFGSQQQALSKGKPSAKKSKGSGKKGKKTK